MDRAHPPIAYVVSRFPALTETFIVREMDALTELGVDLTLYPLVVQRDAVLSEASRRWSSRVRATPWLSREVARANVAVAGRAPGGVLRSAANVIGGHLRSPPFLARAIALAPKAVAFGEDVRERKIHHLHAHFGSHAALAAMIAAKTAGTTFSFTVHAYDLYLDTTFLAQKVRAASFVATISDFNRELLVDLVPDAADRIHVIRCGASPESFLVQRARDERPTEDGPHLLAVAQLAPYKGLRHLIDAAAILRERLPRLTVTIVGEGAERRSLETLRDTLGLGDVVTFAGALPAEQVPGFLSAADIFVLPSVRQADGLMDGIPVALMEAMAAGLPVVASRLSGIPELVEDGVTGLLAEPGDAAGIAGAIERLWGDAELRGRLTTAAGRRLREEFDLELNARRLLRLFEGASFGRPQQASRDSIKGE